MIGDEGPEIALFDDGKCFEAVDIDSDGLFGLICLCRNGIPGLCGIRGSFGLLLISTSISFLKRLVSTRCLSSSDLLSCANCAWSHQCDIAVNDPFKSSTIR